MLVSLNASVELDLASHIDKGKLHALVIGSLQPPEKLTIRLIIYADEVNYIAHTLFISHVVQC